MNWTKYSIATLIGGVSYFFLGWIIFGILLRSMTALPDDIAAVVQIPDDQFKISYMIISCLFIGALYSLILKKWAHVSTFVGGFKTCALVGVLISLAIGFSMSSMFKMQTIDQILINAVGEIFASGITGGLIGLYLGKSKK